MRIASSLLVVLTLVAVARHADARPFVVPFAPAAARARIAGVPAPVAE